MAYRRDGKFTYRAVLTRLFDDPDYQRLSPSARLVLLTARLCEAAGPAAIFRYYPASLTAQTGLTLEQLEAALEELAAGNWVRRDAHLLWVRNGLRFDPSLSLRDQKHTTAVQRWLSNLPQTILIRSFRRYYKLQGPSKGPSKGHRRALYCPEPDPEPEPDSPPKVPHSNDPQPLAPGLAVIMGRIRAQIDARAEEESG
jgi:hypothetical protein